jgi:hypothetical protein
VALRNSVTTADRVGTRAETGLAVLGLAAVIAALITGWRSRRRGDRPPSGTSDSDAAERLRDVFAPTGSSGPVGKAEER